MASRVFSKKVSRRHREAMQAYFDDLAGAGVDPSRPKTRAQLSGVPWGEPVGYVREPDLAPTSDRCVGHTNKRDPMADLWKRREEA